MGPPPGGRDRGPGAAIRSGVCGQREGWGQPGTPPAGVQGRTASHAVGGRATSAIVAALVSTDMVLV